MFQLHRIDPKVDAAEQFGLFRDLQKEGKVRHVGLSEVSVADIEAARRKYVPIVTVQNLYNLDQPPIRKSPRLLPTQKNIGFIPWFPIASGELTRQGGMAGTIQKDTCTSAGPNCIAWLLHH